MLIMTVGAFVVRKIGACSFIERWAVAIFTERKTRVEVGAPVAIGT